MSISINEINVRELLPQQPPFVMVDRLLSCDDKSSVTELEIRSDNVFFGEDCLLTAGLVENIAQTCAAGIGFRNMNHSGSIKIGVIGALNNLEVNRLPKNGERITTTVNCVEEVFQMMMFDAVVKSGEEVLATTSIKTALTDIEAKNEGDE